VRQFRIGAARPFEPQDRLVGARLQQMDEPNPKIPTGDLGVAGAEPDGLLLERDYFLY
jgi:hypothetical protein